MSRKQKQEEKALKNVVLSWLKVKGVYLNHLSENQNLQTNLTRLIKGYIHNKNNVSTVGLYLSSNKKIKLVPFCVMQEYRKLLRKQKYKKPIQENGDSSNFYSSARWRGLRVKALVKYGRKCCLCGSTVSDGVKLHVDHIKPRSKFPQLQYSLSNLQILCEDCNLGKSNKYSDNWRLEN